MVLKLYGFPPSTNTRRVGLYLYEKKIPFELVLIDLAKGEHKAHEFVTSKQPFGQVPVIDDDGIIVFESRAIIRYLEAKYSGQGPKLAPSPSDLKAFAAYEQGASIELANFDPPASKIFFEKVVKPRFKLQTDEALVEASVKILDAKLDVYEVILSKQKYIGGDEYTLVDLFHLPYGEGMGQAGYDLLTNEKRPHVVRWWKDISARDAWVKNKAGVVATTTY